MNIRLTPQQTSKVMELSKFSETDLIRCIRNVLLSESDWTQLSDVNLTQDEKIKWSKYRKELRDITDQPGYPNNVIWPVKE